MGILKDVLFATVNNIKYYKSKPCDEYDVDEEYDDIYGEDADRYFHLHPEEKPEGCTACGGHYPFCMESCPIFDD